MLKVRLERKPRVLVESDWPRVLRDLIEAREGKDRAESIWREVDELVRMRADLKKAASTPGEKKVAALAYSIAHLERALADRASGRDALTSVGAETKKQHYIRSRKAAKTKSEESDRKNRDLRATFSWYQREFPQRSFRNIVDIMRRKGEFDEFGEMPNFETCRARVRRACGNTEGRKEATKD